MYGVFVSTSTYTKLFSFRSQNQYNNGFEPKPEIDDFDDDVMDDDDDDDDSSNFVPEETSSRGNKKKILGRPLKNKAAVQKKPKKIKECKVLHKCDQCDAKYSSLCEYACP